MITALIVLCFLLTSAAALAAPASPELRAAIEAKDAATITSLIAQGDDPNGTWMHDGVGLAPILFAALDTQDVAVLKALLDGGADPNFTRNGDGSTPLTYASARGYPEAVSALLEHGADPNYVMPNRGWHPLGLAAVYGKTEVCGILLKGGAAIDAFTGDGDVAMHMASTHGQQETATFLLQQGADPLLVVAGEDTWSDAIQSGHVGLFTAMLDMGIPVDHPAYIAEFRRPPMVIAASHGQLEIMKLLAARGVDPLAIPPDGAAAIGEAVWYQHPQVVEWLLDQGADVNWAQNKDTTLLLAALYRDNLEIFNLLVDRGADLNKFRMSDGATPWAVAAADGHPRITRRLLELGVDPETPVGDHTAIWEYAYQGNVDGIQALADYKANLNVKHPLWGTTPLYEAVQRKHLEGVRALLDAGADPDLTREGVDERGVAGKTPLTHAISIREFDIALLLLEHNADANKAPIKGYPPLYLALNTDRLDLFKSLLDHGADPDRNYEWGSMLTWCINQDRSEMALALLEHGANPNVQNTSGDWWTPLMLAAYKRNIAVVEALIQNGADALVYNKMGQRALNIAQSGGDPEVIKLITAVTEQQEKIAQDKLKEEQGPHTPVYRE